MGKSKNKFKILFQQILVSEGIRCVLIASFRRRNVFLFILTSKLLKDFNLNINICFAENYFMM